MRRGAKPGSRIRMCGSMSVIVVMCLLILGVACVGSWYEDWRRGGPVGVQSLQSFAPSVLCDFGDAGIGSVGGPWVYQLSSE